MIADAFFDGELMVRVYRDNQGIADLPLADATAGDADESLRAIGLRRTTAWKECDWNGMRCEVAFHRPIALRSRKKKTS